MKQIMSEISYFVNMNNKMYQFLLFIQPIFFVCLTKGIAFVNESEISQDSMLKAALISMVSFIWYSSGSIIFMEKRRGTYELLIASPKPLWLIIFYRSLSYVLVSSVSFVETLVIAIMFFNISFTISMLPLLVSIVTVLLSLSLWGCYFSIIFGFSRNVFELQDLFLKPLLMIIGVFNFDNIIFKFLNEINPLSLSILLLKESLIQENNELILPKFSQWFLLMFIFLLGYIQLSKKVETEAQRTGEFHEFN